MAFRSSSIQFIHKVPKFRISGNIKRFCSLSPKISNASSSIQQVENLYGKVQLFKDDPRTKGGVIKSLKWFIITLCGFLGFASGFFIAKKFISFSPAPVTKSFSVLLPNAKSSQKLPRFSDVIGNDEIKDDLSDIVQFLRNPRAFSRMKATLPKGVLVSGSPGCGKTLMARALAGEAGVPFIYCSGSSFEQMLVGLGASRVRELFAVAKQLAPCIIFIDEIDALSERRNIISMHNRGTINQLLSEMDGFNQSTGIVVLAATNRAETLDSALTRSGRFDRRVKVNLPDMETRRKMLTHFLKRKPKDSTVKISDLAAETTGMSGADLVNLTNTAAAESVKHKRSKISMNDLREAVAILQMGRKRKNLSLDESFRMATAYHEAGHTVAALLGAKKTVSQVTVSPRGKSLGATYQSVSEDSQFQVSRGELMDQMDICMGGFVAEEMVYGEDKVSSGASSDFENASRIASSMVMDYGLGKSMGKLVLGRNALYHLPQSKQVEVGEEVRGLLNDSYERTKTLLEKNHSVFEVIAKRLFENYTLSKEELEAIIR